MKARRALALARKEVLHIRRDRRSLVLAFLIPPALILFFGFAITFDVDDIRLAVWDADRTQASARLVETIRSVHAGRKEIPPEIAAKLADHVASEMLTPRQEEVLRSLAEGK